MRYYFIDFENVHLDGFAGLDKIKKGSLIHVFFSENCKNVSWDIMEKAYNVGVQICPQKVVTGSKNALDFQLSSFLGYMIGKEKNKDIEYIIISKDAGYDAVVDFWKRQGVKIFKYDDMSQQKNVKQSKTTSSQKKSNKGITPTTKKEVLEYISLEEYSDDILNIINQYKTKQAINNGFSKLYKDSKKSGEIYKKLKPLFKNKNKT